MRRKRRRRAVTVLTVPSRCSHDEIEVCFLFVTVQRISIRSEDTLTSWVVVHPVTAPFPFPGSAAFK
ncbi:hypothetical protein BHE74_00022701 [Ensete ventricosum]|nr:hypothetical protein BHE74_00022701 [Ensete ventricosum]